MSTNTTNETGVAPVLHLASLQGSTEPTNFPVNLIRPGTADWYTNQSVVMPLDILKRHVTELEASLDAFGRGVLPLTPNDQMEIERSVKVLHKRIDELLPIAPASLELNDSFAHESVSERWPIELNTSTRQVHMHFRELVFAWRICPQRITLCSGEVTVDEFAETSGISRFIFDYEDDAGNFIDHFDLHDFVTTEPTLTGAEHPESGRPFYYIDLTNKFAPGDVKKFLEVYGSAIMALSVIYDERRRAVSIDNGKFGYVTADHFTAREMIELNRIKQARSLLGLGFKALTESPRQ